MVTLSKDYITIGDINTLSYGGIIVDKDIDGIPERECEVFNIMGRNGDIVVDHDSYKNVQIKYTLFFDDLKMAREFVSDIASISGYVRLEDSEYADEYRIVRLINGSALSRLGYSHTKGTLTIVFDCKPQRWLKYGEFPVSKTFTSTSGGTLNLFNPTSCKARALIHISNHTDGNTLTVYINSNIAISINSSATDIYIDLDTIDAYLTDKSNANHLAGITQKNINLIRGNNAIRVNRACTLEVIPRWWRL